MPVSGPETAVARCMKEFSKRDVLYNRNSISAQTLYLIPEKPYVARGFEAFHDLPPVDLVSNDRQVTYILEFWRNHFPEMYWKHFSQLGNTKSMKTLMESQFSIPMKSQAPR